MGNPSYVLFLQVLFLFMLILSANDRCSAQRASFQLSNTAQFELQRGNKSDSTVTSPPPWWSSTTNSLPLILAEEHYTFHYGRIMYTQPISFVNTTTAAVSSFESYIHFQILRFENYCADGFTFFISPNMSTPYPDPSNWGPAMGIVGWNSEWNVTDPSRHLFAVEFDACKNDDVGDPSDSHIGIDINGVRSNITIDTENTINSDLNLLLNHTFHAWVEFHSAIQTIQVWVTTDSSKPPAPILTLPYNLSTVFHDKMYVGLSGVNGGSLCTVLVYAWNFSVGEKMEGTSSSMNLAPTSPVSTDLAPTSIQQSGVDAGKGGNTVQKKEVIAASVAVVCAVFLICLCVAARLALLKRRKFKSNLTYKDAVRRFSHLDLRKATANFSADRRIGEGGFSTVFKGILPDGRPVAVKRLKDTIRTREAEFTREAQIISSIRHRNLLQLEGWCYELGEALLVYPFLERGSLDKYIYNEASRRELDSERRLKILEGVAAALEYLHGGLSECVLHRDVKAANVLLTEDWEAKLGDFGLARLIEHDETVSVTMAGTPGYTAPEVFVKRKANDKADVYSFGAMALELACGKRVADNLLEWLWSVHESGDNELTDHVLDPVLIKERQAALQQENGDGNGNYAVTMFDKKWSCILHLGLLCCSYVPHDRPTMRQALRVLQDSTVLPLPTTAPPIIHGGPDTKYDVVGRPVLSSSATSSSTTATSGSQSTLSSSLQGR